MAEVYYYLRAANPRRLASVIERVNKVAQGAALMTETTCEMRYEIGYSPVLNNHCLADLQYQAMQRSARSNTPQMKLPLPRR